MSNRVFVSELDDDGKQCGVTHYDSPPMSPGDVTLCGLDTDGDPDIGLHGGTSTKKRVNCEVCIAVVKFCKAI